ncbi:LLM class flavin-dependent oxidoreductase [Rhodococcus sp. NPDC019627]|uniref:LLM class flavin-dependent oxidoreductase n=1 Tax=unclassified Rhodococcus (in: high G+C Gram-positive bacteria) TaxID=192944 RepID=UPI00340B3B7F
MKLDILHALTNRAGDKSWHEVMEVTRRHAILADKLGYDRIWFGEHHFDTDGTDALPNPLMMATDLAARTSNIRFGMAAVSLTLWHPIRVAEDIALLDHYSSGRLDVAFGRGILPIEVMNLNAAASRWDGSDSSYEIFDENYEIVTRLWTEDQFSHVGKRYTFPEPGTKFIAAPGAKTPEGWVGEDGYLQTFGITPRPFQQPMPPLFAVTESVEGFTRAAHRGTTPITWYPTGQVLHNLLELYQNEREKADGVKPKYGADVAVLRLAYVAETDEEARRICEKGVTDFFTFLCRVRGLGVFLDAHEDPNDPQFANIEDPWQFLMDRDHLFIGSVESVRERMVRMTKSHGIQNWLLQMGTPGVDHDAVDSSMKLFAEHIAPVLRAMGND